MGISHTWIAVKGMDSAQALETLGMEVAGPVPPDYLPRGHGFAELPGGWLLVISNQDDIDGLERLAAHGPAVSCQINEHVMYSEAREYAGGTEAWRVIHDPEQGGTCHLEVRGNAPSQLQPIIQEVRAAQDAGRDEEAGVDFIFDVPAKLALSICGFMLGEVEPEEFRYSELRKIGSKRPQSGEKPQGGGFFARLFGRG